MGNPWTLLTSRGKGLLLTALAATVAAVLSGQRDIAFLAAFFIILPVLGAALVLVGRPRFSLDRSGGQLRVPLGESFTQQLVLLRTAGVMPATLLVEDAVPTAFHARTQIAITDIRPRWHRHVSYSLVAAQRGRYLLGPLTVDAIDPFGVARSRTTLPGTSEVLVLPHIAPLSDVSRGSTAGLIGLAARMGIAGADDVMVREYRSGDDVRRIHWRSTARSQQLMVRREEQARDLSVTVLLDTRADAHDSTATLDTFEWAVSAAASIAVHCIEEGFALRQATPDGLLGSASRSHTTDDILTTYAEISKTPHTDWPDPTLWPDPLRDSGLMIAALGRVAVSDASRLAELAGARSGIALVCEADPSAASSPGVAVLRHTGWKVAVVSPKTSIEQAWLSLLSVGGVS